MSWFDDQNNIILDEAAFDKAINDFSELAVQLQSLRNDIETALSSLKSGFDTSAGRKFINSCEENLIRPLERQKLVIDHVSSTLTEVKGSYSTVFTEYSELNTAIKSYQV